MQTETQRANVWDVLHHGSPVHAIRTNAFEKNTGNIDRTVKIKTIFIQWKKRRRKSESSEMVTSVRSDRRGEIDLTHLIFCCNFNRL